MPHAVSFPIAGLPQSPLSRSVAFGSARNLLRLITRVSSNRSRRNLGKRLFRCAAWVVIAARRLLRGIIRLTETEEEFALRTYYSCDASTSVGHARQAFSSLGLLISDEEKRRLSDQLPIPFTEFRNILETRKRQFVYDSRQRQRSGKSVIPESIEVFREMFAVPSCPDAISMTAVGAALSEFGVDASGLLRAPRDTVNSIRDLSFDEFRAVISETEAAESRSPPTLESPRSNLFAELDEPTDAQPVSRGDAQIKSPKWDDDGVFNFNWPPFPDLKVTESSPNDKGANDPPVAGLRRSLYRNGYVPKRRATLGGLSLMKDLTFFNISHTVASFDWDTELQDSRKTDSSVAKSPVKLWDRAPATPMNSDSKVEPRTRREERSVPDMFDNGSKQKLPITIDELRDQTPRPLRPISRQAQHDFDARMNRDVRHRAAKSRAAAQQRDIQGEQKNQFTLTPAKSGCIGYIPKISELDPAHVPSSVGVPLIRSRPTKSAERSAARPVAQSQRPPFDSRWTPSPTPLKSKGVFRRRSNHRHSPPTRTVTTKLLPADDHNAICGTLALPQWLCGGSYATKGSIPVPRFRSSTSA